MGRVALLSRKPAIAYLWLWNGLRLLIYWAKVTVDDQYDVAYALSIGAKINDLGWPWTLKAIMHSVSKHMRLSEPTTKIWMKIDPYYRWQICGPMTWDSGNIRFMRIFAGVPWIEASNDSGIIEKIDFHGFRHLRKCGQHYYIVLFSPLSAFHWPQNT